MQAASTGTGSHKTDTSHALTAAGAALFNPPITSTGAAAPKNPVNKAAEAPAPKTAVHNLACFIAGLSTTKRDYEPHRWKRILDEAAEANLSDAALCKSLCALFIPASEAREKISELFRKLTQYDPYSLDSTPPFHLVAETFYYFHVIQTADSSLSPLERIVKKLIEHSGAQHVLREFFQESPEHHPALFIRPSEERRAFPYQSYLYKHPSIDPLSALCSNYLLNETERFTQLTLMIRDIQYDVLSGNPCDEYNTVKDELKAIFSELPVSVFAHALERRAVPEFVLNEYSHNRIKSIFRCAKDYMDALLSSDRDISFRTEAWNRATVYRLLEPLKKYIDHNCLTPKHKELCIQLRAAILKNRRPENHEAARHHVEKLRALLKEYEPLLVTPLPDVPIEIMKLQLDDTIDAMRSLTDNFLTKPLALNNLHALHTQLALLHSDLMHLQFTTPTRDCEALYAGLRAAEQNLAAQSGIAKRIMTHFPGAGHIARCYVNEDRIRYYEFVRSNNLSPEDLKHIPELADSELTMYLGFDHGERMAYVAQLFKSMCDDLKHVLDNRYAYAHIERQLHRSGSSTKRCGFDFSYLIKTEHKMDGVNTLQDLHALHNSLKEQAYRELEHLAHTTRINYRV